MASSAIGALLFLALSTVSLANESNAIASLFERDTPASPGTVAQDVSAVLNENGDAATVQFRVGAQKYSFDVSRFSVYGEGAQARSHSNGNFELLDIAPSSFQSRADGKWAVCKLDEGRVSGIFEDGVHLIELRHHDEVPASKEETILLEAQSGANATHLAWRHSIGQVSIGGLRRTNIHQADPEIAVDEEPEGVHIFEAPKPGQEPEVELQDGGIGIQSLQKWYPGCYKGDSALHDFSIGIIGDVPASKKLGGSTQGQFEKYVAEASLVYEKQMNLRLKIARMDIYKTDSGSPSYAVGCPGGGKVTLEKLQRMRGTKTPGASVQLFTGCGPEYGIVGTAWIGRLCSGSPHGANKLQGSRTWLTFAHELGHNFAARHSFEDGQGKTGGIMDYGPGRYKGVYQFNTKYRKREVCRMLSGVQGRCGRMFKKSSGGGGGGSPSPDAPSPSPSPDGGERPGKGGKGGKGGEEPSPSPSPDSPSPSPSPDGGERPGKGGKGGKGGEEPSPSPSPDSPSPSPSPDGGERPGKGGKGGKGGTEPSPAPSPDSPSPSPEPSPSPPPSDRRRSRRRRRRRRSA